MKFIKAFFETIRSSFYDPNFYERVKSQPLSPAIKLFAVLGAVGIGFSLILTMPGLISFAYSDLPQKLESSYPDDLVVTIQNGEMIINQPEPYYIKNTIADSADLHYLAIFDGTDQLPNDLQENSTGLLLKRKFAIAPGQNHSQQIIPFSKIGTTTIQKATVVSFIDKFKPYFMPAVLGGGVLLYIFITLIGACFWVLFHMLYVLFPAALVFLFSLLRGSRIKFKESYMISLYASIPVAILFYILFQIALRGQTPQFMYTLTLLLFAVINLSSKERSAS